MVPPVNGKMTPIGQKLSTSCRAFPVLTLDPCWVQLGSRNICWHKDRQTSVADGRGGEAACCHGAGTCTKPGQMDRWTGGEAGCPTQAGWCLCFCEHERSSILVGMQGRSGRDVGQAAAGRMCPIPRAHLAPAASCTTLDPVWFAEPNPLSSSLNLSLTTLASSELYITAWGQACVIKKSWWSLRGIK